MDSNSIQNVFFVLNFVCYAFIIPKIIEVVNYYIIIDLLVKILLSYK